MSFDFLKIKERIKELEEENRFLRKEIEKLKQKESSGHTVGAYCKKCKNSVESYNPILGFSYSCILSCDCNDFEQI